MDRKWRFLILFLSILTTTAYGMNLQKWEKSSVRLDCQFNNNPICCELLNQSSVYYSLKAQTYQTHQLPQLHRLSHHSHQDCTIKKTYISSQYEILQLNKIDEVATEKDEAKRIDSIIKFIESDYPSFLEMLDIILKLMREPWQETLEKAVHGDTVDPLIAHYISRFEVTKECIGAKPLRWNEDIEPLTFYARDIRSFMLAIKSNKGEDPWHVNFPFYTEVQYRGYIIVQNAAHLLLRSKRHHHDQPRRYFFDAGSNLFHTSDNWFTCAYLQRGIDFHSIYSWEKEIFEPSTYWSTVPPRITPFLHFYNEPIGKDPNGTHSVFRVIDQIYREGDFISFKLDIDASNIELPIAFELLRNSAIREKIGEYFFEFHFQCEILKAAWGNVAESYEGMPLDRYHVLQYFLKLRKLGLRAHIWP